MASTAPFNGMAGEGGGRGGGEAPKEVDFYTNPTILSRLILNQKYSSAVKRLKKHPEEASIWVCSKRTSPLSATPSTDPSSTDLPLRPYKVHPHYSLRQLPLHVACANLIRSVNDVTLRTDLERLITHLLVTYPAGCACVDHDGKLPLHEALWLNATPETISMLLIAAPETLHEQDKYGRTPLDLNRLRNGQNKELIKQMLLRGTHFWEQAAAAAAEKMQQLDQAKGEEQGDEKKQKKTTSSSSVAAAATIIPVEDGGRDSDGAAEQETKTPEPISDLNHPDDVNEISWMKLEKRALQLEQLLAGMYEKNYDLGELVQELNQEKAGLLEKVKALEASDPNSIEASNNLVTLQNENTELKSHVNSLEATIQELTEAKNSEQKEEERKQDPDILNYLKERNEILLRQVDELTQANQDYQLKVDRLELLVDSFKKREASESAQVEKPEPNNDDESTDFTLVSAQDFDTLVDTIHSQSHYATERFLAGRVVGLEEQLKDARASADNDLVALRQENGRLMMENKALTVQVASMSGHLTTGPQNGRKPTKPSPEAADNAMDAPSFYDRGNPFRSDNLNEIFQHAIDMCDDSPMPQKVVAQVPDTFVSSNDKQARGTEEERNQSPSGKAAFTDRIIEAARQYYNDTTPPELETALRKASESDVLDRDNIDIEMFLKEAEDLYGEDLPTKLAEALRMASMSEGRVQAVAERSLVADSGEQGVSHPLVGESNKGETFSSGVTEGVVGTRRDGDLEHQSQSGSVENMPPVAYGYHQVILPAADGITEPDEIGSQEFESVMAEAESFLGRPVPPAMRASLQKAALKFLDSEQSAENFDAFFTEAGRDCGEEIPLDLQNAIRQMSGLDDIEGIDDMASWNFTPATTHRAPGSVGDSGIEQKVYPRMDGGRGSIVGPGDGDDDQTLSTMDDGFASIMQEAQRLNGGQSLSPEWMAWWKAARVSASTLPTKGQDESQSLTDTTSLATKDRHEILERYAVGSIQGWDIRDQETISASTISSIGASANPVVTHQMTSVSNKQSSLQSRSASSSDESFLNVPSSRMRQDDGKLKTSTQPSTLGSPYAAINSDQSSWADVGPPRLAPRQSSGSLSLKLNSSSASFYPSTNDLPRMDNLDELFEQATRSYSDVADSDRT